MSDQPRFTHITVNAGDEDDVVIQAGAYRSAAPAPAEQPAGPSEPAPAAVPAQPAEQPAPSSQPGRKPKAERKPEAAYEEQTLEDLEVGPMSGMQKAVLVAVALVIVCGIAYFTLFMH